MKYKLYSLMMNMFVKKEEVFGFPEYTKDPSEAKIFKDSDIDESYLLKNNLCRIELR